MATQNETLQLADSVKAGCDLLKATNAQVDGILAKNSAEAIDWANLPPEWLDEDGNLIGRDYSGQQIANALGAMANYQTFFTTDQVNIELLANPNVVQVRLMY